MKKPQVQILAETLNGRSDEAKKCKKHLALGNMNSPMLSASEKSSITEDLTPCSVISTNDSDLLVLDRDQISEALGSKAEVEMVVKYLKQARPQLQSCAGMDLRLKKLLDALIEVTVKEFCSMPVDRDWMDNLLSAKNLILITCFLMCLIPSAVILLLRFGIGGSAYDHPPPT